MSKDAYYFPHDSNAKDDPKCVMLIEQLGMEGYGIYWMLIETLRDQSNYTYPIALLPALSRRYNTTIENVQQVVRNYGLFEVKDDVIFCSQSLINRMIPFEKRKQLARLAGLESAKKRALKSSDYNEYSTDVPTDVQRTFNECSTIRVDKIRKDKRESTEKNANAFSIPTFSDFENYFIEKGFTIESARKAYEYYSIANWKDSTGKPVRNWKQKCISVWFKDENKQTQQTTTTNAKQKFLLPG